jgi:hypothetical protein
MWGGAGTNSDVCSKTSSLGWAQGDKGCHSPSRCPQAKESWSRFWCESAAGSRRPHIGLPDPFRIVVSSGETTALEGRLVSC